MRNLGTYTLTNDLDKDVYVISATSLYSGEKPCDGAYQIPLTVRDIRNIDDPAKLPFYKGDTDWWYKKGMNHQLLDTGCIYREYPEQPTWVIKVSDLMSFVEDEGQCVISIEAGRPAIEIYDMYRE